MFRKSCNSEAYLDDDVLSFRDGGEVDLDLGQGENVGGSRHVLQEIGYGRFGTGGSDETHRTHHEVGESTVGILISTLGVL